MIILKLFKECNAQARQPILQNLPKMLMKEKTLNEASEVMGGGGVVGVGAGLKGLGGRNMEKREGVKGGP